MLDTRSTSADIMSRADAILDASGLYENPYFTSLAGGAMDKPTFQRSQEQFYWAVLFFARPLAALIARIPDPQPRLKLLQNLVEEHGGYREQAFHETTFRAFLESIGCAPERADLDRVDLLPSTRAFNSVLMTACMADELEVGLSCMGVIEYAFAEISARIGQAVVERGWVTEDQLVHYKLHAAIDREHAADFFELVETSWRDPERRYYVEQGLRLGVFVFDQLYRGMLDERFGSAPAT